MYPQSNIPISVKELRQNFPKLVDRLEVGNSFVLFHRSKPIARIMPYQDTSENQIRSLRFWSNPPKKNRIAKKVSSIALVKKERA